MGLNSALKDRARPVARGAAAGKINGRTIRADWAPVADYQRARLFLTGGPKGDGPGGGPRRAVPTPLLLLGRGGSVFTQTDHVEVDSPELGHAVWRLTQSLEPIRKKRRVIGYQVTVERVEEGQAVA